MKEVRWSPVVQGEGAPTAETLVVCVGLMPQDAEVKAGKPFAGPCGEVVRDVLDARVGGVFYTNLVHQMAMVDNLRVPPPLGAITTGVERVEREIRLRKPYVVVAVGSKVTRHLISSDVQLSRDHGQPMWSSVVDTYVVPIFDFAYVRRRGGLLSEVGEEWLHDIDVVRELVSRFED